MKPFERKAYDVGKNGGTVPTNGLPDATKKAIDYNVNKGKQGK